MKKRFMSVMLILSMLLNMLPISLITEFDVYAEKTSDNKNYNDEDITWLGTTSEYKKTLEVFFDSGLREVSVGNKQGLVNINGAFIAEPIYDEIESYYWNKEDGSWKETNQNKREEEIFVNGYVQATRNGKMGLLDTNGEEVIPCNYDAVGLPSEGISRIVKIVNGVIYIGYWNLELGKEIVAPNKYIIPSGDAIAGSPAGTRFGRFYMPIKEDGTELVAFDFNGGYALVPTGKTESATQKSESGSHDNRSILYYAQIIDKNGKEVLVGGPYAYNATPTITTAYPQSGPYMVYDQMSTKKINMITDTGGNIVYTSHLESGVVGPKGIIIPAQYHGGIWGNAAIGWYPAGAQMEIIAEQSLVMTLKCGYDNIKESAAMRGIVNLNNKEIIPFSKTGVTGYDYDNKVFYGFQSQPIYRVDGTKIVGTEKRATNILNGYVTIGTLDTAGHLIQVQSFISIKDGKSYTHENFKGSASSEISDNGTVWIKKNNKWGLVNLDGKIILPFEYDEIIGNGWIYETLDYAIVKKSDKWGIVDSLGKILLPCNYKSIQEGQEGYINIQDYNTEKYGIYSFKSNKITVEPKFNEILHNSIFRESGWGSIAGTAPIKLGDSLNALLNMDSGKQVTNTYLVMKPMSRGLFFNTHGDIFGPDGKIIFSRGEGYESYTLIVKDGKVGSINASRLKIAGKLPTTTFIKPAPKTITPRGYLVAYPENRVYPLGEGFDITGLIVHYEDENGVRSIVDNSKLKFYTSGTVELTQGRKFTSSGIKTVEVQYNGKKVDVLDVTVISDQAGNILESGDCYIQVYGKYLYPVYASGIYWMELSDKKPDKPYTVKLVNYSEDRGPKYNISYDGVYINQPASQNGNQLQSSRVPHAWRINKYKDFCTIRDYGNQKLIVNASGQKSDNGTKVIVWSSSGSAPENAKLVFVPVK